jgi:hypothetical protein
MNFRDPGFPKSRTYVFLAHCFYQSTSIHGKEVNTGGSHRICFVWYWNSEKWLFLLHLSEVFHLRNHDSFFPSILYDNASIIYNNTFGLYLFFMGILSI